MATAIGSAITPYRSQWKNQGVVIKLISGTSAGGTKEIAAATELTRHVIVGGRISIDGAGDITLKSAANTIDLISFVCTGTANLPVGLETVVNEALQITVENGAVGTGWIAYASILDGDALAI